VKSSLFGGREVGFQYDGYPLLVAIVSEHPSNPFGRVDTTVAPGWYALRDRAALRGSDIVDPRQESALGESAVTFGMCRKPRIWRRLWGSVPSRLIWS
jgi:hypothetical protein